MTYREICDAFRRVGIETPEWDAQLLAERFCHTDRLSLLSDPNRDLHAPLLEDAVRRRCAREPLQYLLGEWEFYRQRYEISPDCLIPRADTEILVEEAVKRLPKGAFFADLCTGSGCIAVSVLAERPDTRALAVELSPRALELAERNARRNGVSERFSPLQADVLHFSSHLHPRPHAILSNPPYIRSEIVPTLAPEVLKEPRMALDGGEDGLIFYRALVKLAREWLDDGGFCLFEIGFDQGDAITELAAREGFSCTLRRDYGGCDRVAILDIK